MREVCFSFLHKRQPSLPQGRHGIALAWHKTYNCNAIQSSKGQHYWDVRAHIVLCYWLSKAARSLCPKYTLKVMMAFILELWLSIREDILRLSRHQITPALRWMNHRSRLRLLFIERTLLASAKCAAIQSVVTSLATYVYRKCAYTNRGH